MKFGFVIDNRKCIGCHACTVACKSEHDVAIGVNRTWVKQVEKGEFPNTRRLFSVLRCNHCTHAPCVEICPVQSLYIRDDGIVDFDNERCIGCKACMQACPYDALYIDPETETAAKCNYCSHRVDIGLEPACVNVCPEHAIISGDMDNQTTEIAQLLAREQVTVRRPEKSTIPNVFYINGDQASLNPTATKPSDSYIWNSQEGGVGHFARYAEGKKEGNPSATRQKSVEALMNNGSSKRVYDTPDKGLLWGWEVSAYVWTKAISSGLFLVWFLKFLGKNSSHTFADTILLSGSLLFLGLTGALLVKDLDQPKRFLYVLLRPQWKSWLVKGGYAITVFGGIVTAILVLGVLGISNAITSILAIIGLVAAVLVSLYTAFLFAQAKGRDFWRSPMLPLHMFIHTAMAGCATTGLISVITPAQSVIYSELAFVFLQFGIIANIVITIIELNFSHSTNDASLVAKMITHGKYRDLFWLGAMVLGNAVPLTILAFNQPLFNVAGCLLALAGIYLLEKIWVEAPQQIPLT